MGKQDIIDAVAEKLNTTDAGARKSVNAVFEVLTEALQRRDVVVITGFGKFFVKFKQKRMARNPKTGEMVKVPAKEVVVFKPGKDLTLQG